MVSRIETDKSGIAARRIQRTAEVLEVSVEYLVGASRTQEP